MRACALALLTLALGGCGFHLEGHAGLPVAVKTPFVDTQDRQSDFVQSLERALLMNGAQLAPGKTKASAVINLAAASSPLRALARGRLTVSLHLRSSQSWQ